MSAWFSAMSLRILVNIMQYLEIKQKEAVCSSTAKLEYYLSGTQGLSDSLRDVPGFIRSLLSLWVQPL